MHRISFGLAAWCLALLWVPPAQALSAGGDALPATLGGCSAGAVGAIDESFFVDVGGIGQWITITGSRCDNPVVLVLHGGPGNPMSPYARNVYADWHDDFTLVQWDQRGAGQTYGRNAGAAKAKLTIARMAQDGIELAAFLVRHLNAPKLILLGGSWGSVLGVHMAQARPDLFAAYVGAGQLVDGAENPAASYRKVLALAHGAGDAQTASTLEAIGPPPWSDPRHFGTLRRATRVYERKVSDPAPRSWWAPSAAYATREAQEAYEAGEEFSYLEFVGPRGDGMLSQVDLRTLGTTFEIPVFLIQGAEDLVTVPEVARRYFDEIAAPEKDFIVLPRTGHDPNAAMIEAEFRVLKARVVPRTNRR